jgi:hypothetical protein
MCDIGAIINVQVDGVFPSNPDLKTHSADLARNIGGGNLDHPTGSIFFTRK